MLAEYYKRNTLSVVWDAEEKKENTFYFLLIFPSLSDQNLLPVHVQYTSKHKYQTLDYI